MGLLASNGAGNPSGSLGTIAATPTAAAAGDFVVIVFAWAIAGKTITGPTVTDALGNVWTVTNTPGATLESGGTLHTIVTTGWSASSNTVTATLAAAATGSGRIWQAAIITATNNPSVGAVGTPSQSTTNAPSVTTGTLPQATCTVMMSDVVRASAGTSSLVHSTTGAYDHPPGFEAGSGSPASGGGFIAIDNTVGTTAVTLAGTSTNAGDVHGLNFIIVKTGSGSALDAGALSIAGAGNIAIASAQQGFLAGAFTIPGAGNIAVSAASQGIVAGAFTIPGAGNIAISATQLGKLVGALSIPGAGNILLGASITSSKDLGALVVTGAGNIAVSAADLAHFTGALTIPGAGSIAIASTRQGFLAGALQINGAGTINTAGISSGGNVVVGALSLAGSGLITVTAAQLAQLLGALSIAGQGNIVAAFAADPNAPIIITRLNDGDIDFHFVPRFY